MNITNDKIKSRVDLIVNEFKRDAMQGPWLYTDYRRCVNYLKGMELLTGENESINSGIAELEAHYNQIKQQAAA